MTLGDARHGGGARRDVQASRSPRTGHRFSESLERRCLLSGVDLAFDLDTRTESAFPDTSHQIVVAGDLAFGDPAVSRTYGHEELARSDGTREGTRIVTEIVPGLAGTKIGEMRALGTLVLFTTLEPNETTGRLWRSDGTESGTYPLLGWTGTSGLSTNLWEGAELGGKYYFAINDHASHQRGLGVTDGTGGGTAVVKWLGSLPERIMAFNGSLYFRSSDVPSGGSGVELWKSDGTTNGTAMLKDLIPGSVSSDPDDLTAVGNTLFFTAGLNGSLNLYKTDGTAAGTQSIKSTSSIRAATSLNGKLVYSIGSSIYRSDGTFAGTTLVKSMPFEIWGFETAGSRAYLVQNGTTYWQTDGTAAGTVPVSSSAGAMTATSADMTRLGSKMLLRAKSPALGDELWITDGTVAGTTLVADLLPGTASASPWMMASNAAGTRAFFTATDGTTGREMWVSDGTAAGTNPTADLNRTGVGAMPRELTKVGDAVYLWTRSAPVRGLYKTDGTQSGTSFLGAYEISGRPEASRAVRTAAVGNRFFFSGRALGTTHFGYELHVSDGTPAGTHLVKDLTPGTADSWPENLLAVSDVVFFFTGSGTSRTLWRSNGSETGTVQVETGVGASIAAVGDTLYFSKGGELWKVSAGGGAGAQLVASGLPTISGVGVVGAHVLLWCESGTTGDFLYRSDGTQEGTRLVSQLPTSYSAVRDITDLGDGSAVFGYQGLWRTDLTGGGTVKIASVEPNYANVLGATAWYRGELYFKGREPVYGRFGLWKTDGTAGGTSLVSDRTGDFVEELTVADGRLFFRGYGDGSGGTGAYGVWESDGSAAGTRRVPGQPVDQWLGYPAFLTEVNRSLLFVSDDRALAGEEVFKILPETPAPAPAWLAPGSAANWYVSTRTLVVTGDAIVTADPAADVPFVVGSSASANLMIAPAAGTRISFGGLSLSDGATVTLSDAAAGRVLVIGDRGLSVTRSGKLDLTDNALVVAGGSPSSVEAAVSSGYHGGDWLGLGIVSSTAATDPNFTLAVAANANLLEPFGDGVTGPLFAGVAVDETAILVRFTHRADLNLNGRIDSNDAFVFNLNYNEGESAPWMVGDVDFDGLFSSDDAFLFNLFYNENLTAV